MYTIQSPHLLNTIQFPPLPLETVHSLAGACLWLQHHGFPHFVTPTHTQPTLYYQVLTDDETLHSAYLIHLPKENPALTLLNDLLTDLPTYQEGASALAEIAFTIHRLEYCLTLEKAAPLLTRAVKLLLAYAQSIDEPYTIIGYSDTTLDLLSAHQQLSRLPFQGVLVHGLLDQLFDFASECFDWPTDDLLLTALDQTVQALQHQSALTANHEG